MRRTVARAAAVAAVLDQAFACAGRRVLLLDGGSGSGKTGVADELARAWRPAFGADLQVVHLDDVYPGWHGLEAGSAAVTDTILRTADPGHLTWDWAASRPGPWVRLDSGRPILVEGCGALTRASAPLACVRVWLELDAATRRARALARDEGYGPWWDAWAVQERAHWRRNRPRELATLLVRDSGRDDE